LHQLTIPAAAPAGDYLIIPRLELAVLELNPAGPIRWYANRPLELKPGEFVLWDIDDASRPLELHSAQPAAWRVTDTAGNVLKPKIVGNVAKFPLTGLSGALRIEFAGAPNARQGWFKIETWATPEWVTARGEAGDSRIDWDLTTFLLPEFIVPEPPQPYEQGKFGQAASIRADNKLRIPDHVVKDGKKERLFDEQQGTIEFWIYRKYDDRLNPLKPLPQLTNGLLNVSHQPTLPLKKWAHIAVVWHSYLDRGTIQYVYVNGCDAANYRSINWDGYSAPRPSAGPKNAKWLEEFVLQAREGSEFEIDELRVSKTARYADRNVKFGPQQTFNPIRFQPPEKAFEADEQTTLLLHFDGDLKSAAKVVVEGKFE
jgi:hypothetical protein